MGKRSGKFLTRIRRVRQPSLLSRSQQGELNQVQIAIPQDFAGQYLRPNSGGKQPVVATSTLAKLLPSGSLIGLNSMA